MIVPKQDPISQLSNLQKAVFEGTGSTADANRLYSILLDTKESAAAENMYDIAETLMRNEKNNSKIALDQLWALKKNITDEGSSKTVDMLINHFQEKLNILRNKEENIKKISKTSRELLEDKRKRDTEIATVKQQISDCSDEVERLNKKLSELNFKEQELTLIDTQLHKELQTNTNEVINGLYEIVFSNFDQIGNAFGIPPVEKIPPSPFKEEKTGETRDLNQLFAIPAPGSLDLKMEGQSAHSDFDVTRDRDTKNTTIQSPLAEESDDAAGRYQELEVPFPKSSVKTTNGSVIGEYYYDPKVEKNRRHYVYNSNFFRKRLMVLAKELLNHFSATQQAEALQVVQDAYKRITEKTNLHFEISTNEILNKNTLKDLWQNIMQHEYGEIITVCNKLKAKIDMLGKNYIQLLTEQITRFNEN